MARPSSSSTPSLMEAPPPPPRAYGSGMKLVEVAPPRPPASQQSDNDRSSGELRALDCNLTSLCDHIQIEGFNSGVFSDIVIHAMGSSYHLHRLILSRSSYFSQVASIYSIDRNRSLDYDYFIWKLSVALVCEKCEFAFPTIEQRNMLHGPWKEANAPIVTLQVDDDNVNGEAITIALAYLYGTHPKLNDNNAFRVLAAASFLDLQDLCAICTDFIISELWTSNFLAYQVFAESQDYGIHGERVRNACWGYLCQSASMELKEVLPKLSSQTLHALLTSDELWVPSEEKRFELAIHTLLAKCALSKVEPEQGKSSFQKGPSVPSDATRLKGKTLVGNSTNGQNVESEVGNLNLNDNEGHKTAHNILVELADSVVELHTGLHDRKIQGQEAACSDLGLEGRYSCKMEHSASFTNSLLNSEGIKTPGSHFEMPNAIETSRKGNGGVAIEGPSEDSVCYHLNNNIWRDQSQQCSSSTSPRNEFMTSEWGRCGMQPSSWGGGTILYCNMSFEALLNVRKQLEELGFACKAVNDGLWLQMLLSYKVQEVLADTCKNCCLASMACACRQSYGFSQGAPMTGYYVQEHDRNNPSGIMGNVYVTEAGQSEGNFSRSVRVHVRGPIDGLAGIGRGATFVPATAWPPTRFVFSRVPFGMGNRNGQQSLGNDEPEARADLNGELSGDGLTALVGLSQGGEQTERVYESDVQSRLAGASVAGPSTSGIPVQVLDSHGHSIGLEWDDIDGSSISLDMKTPLQHFPPFRFGVEFEEVHRLADGQVKHSPEVYYVGSLWKVSVQAFNDEDPQGRRTLGLFLHRRKAEVTDYMRKGHMFVDTREKVTARYQLICPSKREVMVFGSFKQAGTLLPKAPKGWGWRTALLFDELADLLQGGALRVVAVVQLV
ncbi:hypothetical protein Sjap_007490 [Stephania japonica]|uniref:BTB domain-containing protein n=1 Tax=Stephania japonica TaxID=461633 RepID=A0AAP0JMP8_9MAGN